MKATGGAAVARALEDEGVPFTFGIPGTHNIELYDALAASGTVEPVLVTDEQSASFMADAVWRASGKLACVNVVPGAGLTHALSGIAEAFLDQVPLLVLGCGIRTDTGKAFQLHDVDQLAMVRAVTKAQIHVERGEDLYPAVRRACRLARAAPGGPVMVEVPANLYLFEHDFQPADAPATEVPAAPDPAALERAAALLAAARRPLLYVGLGAAGVGADLVTLAERLQAPVATTIQGKGVFPESHPLALWPGFGDAAPPFARRIATECDATLAIGCRFGEVATASYGLTPPAPLIHVDIDPAALGRNYPAALAVCADAAAFVAALLPRLGSRSPDTELRAAIREGHAAVRRGWHSGDAGTVTPPALLAALQARLGPDTIFTADSGNGTFWAMEALRLERPGKLLAPVDYSCMGYAVPAAIGARLACPATPVVALAGDGAFLMTGLELLTAAARGAAVAVFVLRDRELAQIAQFQDVALARKTASVLPDYDLGAICRGVGVECLELKQATELPSVLDRVTEATGAGRPVAVDVAIDYSTKTFFTRGVVKTNFGRLPWRDRLRFAWRAVARRVGAAVLPVVAAAAPPPAAPPLRLYVPNQMAASVSVLDGGGHVLATVDLRTLGFSPHAMPHQVAAAPDGSAWYVTLAGDGFILKFDRDDRLVAKTRLDVPGMIVLDPRRDRLYVSRALNAVNPPTTLGVIRASDMTLVEEADVFIPRNHALAVDTVSGRVYTASLSTNQIAAFDPQRDQAWVTDVAGPAHGFVGLGTSPDGRRVVATTQITDQLLAFDAADPHALKQIAAVPVAAGPYDVTFSPDGRAVWVPNQLADCATQVDASTWTVVAVVKGDGFAEPHGVVVTPDSRTVYISNHGHTLIKVAMPQGMPMSHDMESPRAKGTVVAIDVATHAIRTVTEVGEYAAALGIAGR